MQPWSINMVWHGRDGKDHFICCLNNWKIEYTKVLYYDFRLNGATVSLMQL